MCITRPSATGPLRSVRGEPGEADSMPAAAAGGIGDWAERLRSALVDKPDAHLTLGQALPGELLPDLACTLPWTRLEMSTAVAPLATEGMAPNARALRAFPSSSVPRSR